MEYAHLTGRPYRVFRRVSWHRSHRLMCCTLVRILEWARSAPSACHFFMPQQGHITLGMPAAWTLGA